MSSGQTNTLMSKRKRNVLSLKDKLDIISALKSGVARSQVAEKYDIGLSTVADIYRREDEFREFANTNDPSRRVMRKSANDEMDDVVYTWYQIMRASGQTVNGNQLCDKALVLNRKLNGDPMFKASHGWLQRFKSRRGISFDQKKAESPPETCPQADTVIPNDEEIIQRCLVAVKTETRGGDAVEGGGDEIADTLDRDNTQDAYLDSSTGFIRRKKRRRRLIATKTRKHIDTLEEMKQRKLALEIEQLELRNHLCRIEIYQAEKQNMLEPSVYTESFYSASMPAPFTEIYVKNGDDTPQ